MIYKAVEVICIFFADIFLADGRTDGLTEVFQEVLADLKICNRSKDKEGSSRSETYKITSSDFELVRISVSDNVHYYISSGEG